MYVAFLIEKYFYSWRIYEKINNSFERSSWYDINKRVC
ncbi:hypothetical protein SPBRAN_1403 [uncultured Candidatus Thioglobus sp.]|nr:hypothetical protein SPBRAN_1403 [uncultured Candidatus Thioglobus sp.]